MYHKLFVKFCAGDFSLDNVPRLGTPVEVDSNKIKTLIENNQCFTMQEIANILKISKSIRLSMKMRNVSFILWKKTRLFGQPNRFRQRCEYMNSFPAPSAERDQQ